MRNIKLCMSFNGTSYSGWQKQNNSVAIENVVEKAVSKANGCETKIFGCSRTDKGVHARNYICNFKTDSTIPDFKYKEILNGLLPDDIFIKESIETFEDFHSRFSTKRKTYSYNILLSKERDVFNNVFIYQYKYDIDISKIKEASKKIIGKHDFGAFKSLGSITKDDIREVFEIEVELKGDILKIFITADGFLYNMARIIVGTLIMIGNNRKDIEDIDRAFETKNSKYTGKCMPSKGLILENVYY